MLDTGEMITFDTRVKGIKLCGNAMGDVNKTRLACFHLMPAYLKSHLFDCFCYCITSDLIWLSCKS